MNSIFSQTIKLLRIIGSPFDQTDELPEDKKDAFILLDYAKKNKVALIYLESLKYKGKLDDYGLDTRYNEEQRKHNEQIITICRISELFNSSGIDYAIFKSIMPFSATPNDVDIIHFGSDNEYKQATKIMLKSGYIEIKGFTDAEQRMFHDTRFCNHSILSGKDIYDIDLYQRISASYIQYLDKEKFKKYVVSLELRGTRIKVILPEAELIALIIHSIIPEMLLTLHIYYATLYYLVGIEDIDKIINISKENNVTFSVKVHFSLIAELHRIAHGFIPNKLANLIDKLGTEKIERENLVINNYATPHKYCVSTIFKILLEKSNEAEFRRSALKQTIYMLNPKMCKWVILNVLWRRRRETY